MSNEESGTDGRSDGDGDDRLDERRRRLLLYGGLTALAGTGVASGWYVTRDGDGPEETPTPGQTETPAGTPTDGVPAVVARYAPDLYFGRLEKWFPTDPRDFVDAGDEPQTVDGIRALEEYSAAYTSLTDPPNPTVFYRVVQATDDVDALQYYFYSAFDQFSVNFHWHDWELLQVFVDRETDEPLLLCASAHKDPVPNNEVMDPDLSGGKRPGVLSEVGSHSSASEVNGLVPTFERIATGDVGSDVTNDFVDLVSGVSVPFAYGLPRDEGARIPFLEPELDGKPLYRHPDLSVERADFIDNSVTVENWKGLPAPPTDLPRREPGLVLTHPESDTDADAHYTLEPIEALEPVISDFDGPTLEFQFTIPGFVKDRLTQHVKSVGTPWKETRYVDPLSDISDEVHRRRLSGRAPDSLRNRVVGRVRQLRSGADGALEKVSDDARDALEDSIDVSLSSLPTEVVTQVASTDPVASVTRNGEFGYLRIDPGEHRLVVNGPGYAPLAQRFVHEGGTHRVGANGDLAVVANEDAVWVKGDGRDASGVRNVRVVEDYAGTVYDGRPVESDRFAVAVHDSGTYTVEVTDDDGRRGSYRVGPADFDREGQVVIESVETGKTQLIRSLNDYLTDLRDLASRLRERDGAEGQVVERLSSALQETDSALAAAEERQASSANDSLQNVVSLLEEALDLLRSGGQDGYSDSSVAALDPRIRDGIVRADVAIATELA